MLARHMRVPKKLFPLLRKNKLFEGEFFSIRVTYGVEKGTRLICIVSKKIDKRASARNKIKRQVYSILIPLLRNSNTDTTIQIFPKKTSLEQVYIKLESDLTTLLRNNNLI
jgi:ribonuclease P protein component